MRTNIDIDDALLDAVMRILAVPTKKAAVEEALRRIVDREAKRNALNQLRGMGWDGDLDAMRGPYADEIEENREYFEQRGDELAILKAFYG